MLALSLLALVEREKEVALGSGVSPESSPAVFSAADRDVGRCHRETRLKRSRPWAEDEALPGPSDHDAVVARDDIREGPGRSAPALGEGSTPMTTVGEALITPAGSAWRRYGVRHSRRAHDRALSRAGALEDPPCHAAPRAGRGFMADGYARVSGRPGVAFVITGPGLTNIITAMAQARADFGADAGDLRRQRRRHARQGPRLSARTARPARHAGDHGAVLAAHRAMRPSCRMRWRGPSRCSPRRGRGRCISRSRST